jgi:hypothetical protein
VVIGGPDATIHGSPSLNLPLRVPPFYYGETPVAEVTDRRHASDKVASQGLDDHIVDFFPRVPGDALQRHHTAVTDKVDMGIDQPRQHGRIAVVQLLTIRRRLVRRRLDFDDAPILDKHCGTTGREIVTVEGMVCTDGEHTAWLPNPPTPVNGLPV